MKETGRPTPCILAMLLSFAMLAPTNVHAQGSAAIPRTADGKPDFSGIWQAMNTAAWDIQDHAAQKGVPGGQGVVVGNEIPYQQAALAGKKENYEKRASLDPGQVLPTRRAAPDVYALSVPDHPDAERPDDALRARPCRAFHLYQRNATSAGPDRMVAG